MRPQLVSDTILIERDPDLVHAALDSETVMMSIARGCYFGLNAVGARIWALLEKPTSVDALCRCLVAEYEVDDAECRCQVERFVGELLSLGIVRSCPKP